LVALPGDVHLLVRVARVQAMADLGLLLLGEVFRAVAEQPADLVQRVVLVAAAAQGVLLHAAADFVDRLGAEPDHVEGVEDPTASGSPWWMALWSRVGARCPAFLLARFPDPLPEPDVRLPPHPALHEVLPVGQPTGVVVACRGVQGV